MVVEAVQTYVNLVNGLSRATRERARSAAHGLLAQAGLEDVANDAERRVAKLTEEILGASRANRELLENLVASEVTKVASRLGFVRSDDLDEVREEIAELRAQLNRDRAGASGTPRARNAAARRAAASAAGTTSVPDVERPPSPAPRTPPPSPEEEEEEEGGTTSTQPGAAQRLAAESETGAAPTQPAREDGA